MKVYMEIICDQDVADELFSYPPERVDIIRYDEDPDVIIEMGGEKYRTEETEALPINENIAKGFEEFTKMMFKQGQAEREEE